MAPKLYMFPGQGSQYAGMAKDWFDNFQEARHAFEEGSDGSSLNLKKLCFDGGDADLKQTEITQPALVTATMAIYFSLRSIGAVASDNAVFMGHSLGEYSALVAGGFFRLVDAARIVRKRGLLMQNAVPAGEGGMAALIFKPGTDALKIVEELCLNAQKQSGKLVSAANFNSPEQIVVAGHAEAIAKVCELAPAAGVRKAVPLAVSAPFHCELMAPAAEGLRVEIEKAVCQPQKEATYIANVDAQIHGLLHSAEITQRLLAQITAPVLWSQSVQTALARGVTEAVEVGPGAVLTGLAKRIPWQEHYLQCQNVDRLETFKAHGSV